MVIKEYTCFLYIVILVSFISCKEQPKQEQKQKSVQLVEDQMPIKIGDITDQEMEVLHTIKKDFDDILNADHSATRTLAEQYDLNLAGLNNSFLQGTPISLNFPYNNKLRLSAYNELLLTSELWSYKCGFSGKDGNIILNYYCLNTNGPIFDYLKKSCSDNVLIQSFVTDYLQLGDFSPGIQKSILLQAKRSLDFQNPHHQMFWLIYHLSLNETMNANKQLNEYKKDLVAKENAES